MFNLYFFKGGVSILSMEKISKDTVWDEFLFKFKNSDVYGKDSYFLVKEDKHLGDIISIRLDEDPNKLRNYLGMENLFVTENGYVFV
jgi:hypothetical protein